MLPAGHPYADIITRVLKPGRYTGGEHNQVRKDPSRVRCRIALAYPDAYEIGMSHMGLKILYSLVNRREHLAAERVFAPWPDMEAELRRAGLPLVSLESATPLAEFDLLGFSLQYELTYSNILQMLDLGGIPRRSLDRDESHPLILAGGPLVFSPEPLAPFIDVFVVGDGEEALPELMEDWADLNARGLPRVERLRRLARKRGRYVPRFYETRMDPDTGLAIVQAPADEDLPHPIARAQVPDLNAHPFPVDAPVPESSAVFDRHGIELARGCTEGCRFCQAGMIYRPVRERSPEQVVETVMAGLRESGYDEVSLTSLSTADYSAIVPLVKELVARLDGEEVSLAVSSLRAYGLPEELLDEIAKVRATSLTFAPEAGTQRMRDVVNKNVSEEQILETARRVFSRNWDHMKLYFMIGLPTETMADVRGIVETGKRCRAIGEAIPGRNRKPRVICAVSSHVPKPHTPFQWCAMDSMEELNKKQRELFYLAKRNRVEIKWHGAQSTHLEGILSRGDRRVADLIERAYDKGCRFDSWDEQFRFADWMEAVAELGLDEAIYLSTLPVDARLPWEHIDPGVTREFLADEYRKSLADRLSPPCGKPKGAVVHPASLAEAEAQDKPLVCFHCGIVCDLEGMKRERLDWHRKLVAMTERRPERVRTEPVRYRLVFAKEGEAVAMSHLDLLRLWPRLLRRAGVPVAYTQGFHPRPRLSFSPALPMGMPSRGEQLEIVLRSELSESELISRLSGTLPEGIRLLDCKRGESKPLSKRLRSQRLLVEFAADEDLELAAACGALLARGSIRVERAGRARTRQLEMRPSLIDLRPAEAHERIDDEDAPATKGEACRRRVVMELSTQGDLGAALKAGELVELLGGDASSLRALRLGFTLEETERVEART